MQKIEQKINLLLEKLERARKNTSKVKYTKEIEKQLKFLPENTIKLVTKRHG